MNRGIPAPGCPPPGGGGGDQGASPRRHGRRWPGLAAATVAGVVTVLATLAAVHLLHRPGRWVLTAPPTAAGLRRDRDPADQISFDSAVAKFRSSVASLPTYRHLTSTVTAVYALGSAQAVGFVGFNGTFSEQLTLKTTSHLAVTGVDPGPHGGAAGCGSSPSATVCDWSTGTTVGIVVIASTSGSGHAEPITAADKLMIRLRGAVEHQAGGGLAGQAARTSSQHGQPARAARAARAASTGRRPVVHATNGVAPDSLVMARPADSQPSIPSATLMTCQPAEASASVARADRRPDLQMT
jgi:hypothetical protein